MGSNTSAFRSPQYIIRFSSFNSAGQTETYWSNFLMFTV